MVFPWRDKAAAAGSETRRMEKRYVHGSGPSAPPTLYRSQGAMGLLCGTSEMAKNHWQKHHLPFKSLGVPNSPKPSTSPSEWSHFGAPPTRGWLDEGHASRSLCQRCSHPATPQKGSGGGMGRRHVGFWLEELFQFLCQNNMLWAMATCTRKTLKNQVVI